MVFPDKFSVAARAALFLCVLPMAGCEQGVEQPVITRIEQASVSTTDNADDITSTDFKFDRDDPRYLFDASAHTVEELTRLLYRAEEVLLDGPVTYEDLDIVLILHGPDINLFRKSNYHENRELVDLAAKLDAYRIIDLKICDSTMTSMGITRNEVPPFIEPVPYAPKEIERLTNEGYFNL